MSLSICNRCKRIPLAPPRLEFRVQHHSTFEELDDSARNGCRICLLFRKVLLEYYSYHLSCSAEHAESYHRSIDQKYPQKRHEQSGEVEACAFFVELSESYLDDISTRDELAFQGLKYVRQDPASAYYPLDLVYPYVDVLSLSGSTGQKLWNIMGRPVPPVIDFQLAESWLSDCCQNDESCSTASDARLPTRILDLGPPNSSQDLCVLVTGEAYERYATLSHCWGTSRPLELKSQNFEDFQKRIAFDTLPKTFQDAVTATRSLRLRYLWIDSLCIIQDSRSDWEDQCAKMAQIYAGSFVTLAGPAASGCQSGFLSLRPIPYHLQLEVSDGENYDNIILAYNSTRRLLGRFKPEPNSPLAERAWVLQERLLSRRILYFGSTRMYFECFTKTRFEDCHYPKVWDPISAGMVRKLRIAHIGSFPECFAYWEELITTYSRMKLTHATDRLPALSGLASDFQGVIGARYLAGVWENDIVRELAWRILSNEMVKPPAILSSDYIAPSWSWAAASRGIHFAFDNRDKPMHTGIRVVDSDVTIKGLNPLGAVEHGWIDLKGMVLDCVVEQDLERELPTYYVHSGEPHYDELSAYFPDNPPTPEQLGSPAMLLYLGQDASAKCAALVIEPIVQNKNAFRRTGLAFGTNPLRGKFEDAYERQLRML